ncbi:hypothetical protein SAMD00019534_018390 [Acytostelium subglobosum LB1]|uniref:hypothetical protein n=1 Tax=Acytostelium subglobosum LB1 TaxID=1410327 RepID=UPI000644D294|nr:hypothetical protein SAMD00019534_018390 [Acytostelium subglobosum LB1]GAM18664.1 hypothetical protein SAMD00019534_018390 [Acytostelium subglobosum LB1]|eukprot:XP_012757884.1 hypothetical protein SAMD00019534_018390 [Acytostelium subglobosum LB1]
MNRVNQYKWVLLGAASIGFFIVTPACKPVFGTVFGGNQAKEERLKQLLSEIKGQDGSEEHHESGHSSLTSNHH